MCLHCLAASATSTAGRETRPGASAAGAGDGAGARAEAGGGGAGRDGFVEVGEDDGGARDCRPVRPFVPPAPVPVGTATSTCSPSVSPRSTWVCPPELSPVVIVRRTCLPPFGTSTVVVPLVRLIARLGTRSTSDSCL